MGKETDTNLQEEKQAQPPTAGLRGPEQPQREWHLVSLFPEETQ